MGYLMRQTFGLRLSSPVIPRALLWASMGEPVGLEGNALLLDESHWQDVSFSQFR
jgi:hypothetical protein